MAKKRASKSRKKNPPKTQQPAETNGSGSQKLLSLDHGLELWKIPTKDLREQDVNARAMSPEMFVRLTTTIQGDNRLESLPFCALTEKGAEVVSGHHRVRAAIAAGLTELYVLVDSTGLNRDQISSKQLAHNSIQGEDDTSLLHQIYSSIKDAEARLEAFVNLKPDDLPQIKTHDIDLTLDYKSVLVIFLSDAKDRFDKIAQEVSQKVDGAYIADLERFDQFKTSMLRIGAEYDIRSIGTILAKMCDIVAEHLGEETLDMEKVSLRDILKTAYVPTDAAKRLEQLVEKVRKQKHISSHNSYEALDIVISEYLDSHD